MAIQICAYEPMKSRPCKYCLALQESSVFADFNVREDGCLYLVAISFDGYGYCLPDVSKKLTAMSIQDSRILIGCIESDNFLNSAGSEILKSYFLSIKHSLWEDALLDHGLI